MFCIFCFYIFLYFFMFFCPGIKMCRFFKKLIGGFQNICLHKNEFYSECKGRSQNCRRQLHN